MGQVVVVEVKEGCDRHVRAAIVWEARHYVASIAIVCWSSVILGEASARNEAAQRMDRVSIFGCDCRGLRRVGEWRSGQQRSDRLSRRSSSSSSAAHRDRARCCGVAVVSGLYEDGMLTQAASRVKLSLMDARAWSGWLLLAVCLAEG